MRKKLLNKMSGTHYELKAYSGYLKNLGSTTVPASYLIVWLKQLVSLLHFRLHGIGKDKTERTPNILWKHTSKIQPYRPTWKTYSKKTSALGHPIYHQEQLTVECWSRENKNNWKIELWDGELPHGWRGCPFRMDFLSPDGKNQRTVCLTYLP